MEQNLKVLADTYEQDIQYLKTNIFNDSERKMEESYIETARIEYLKEVAMQVNNMKMEIQQLNMQMQSAINNINLHKTLIDMNEEGIKKFTYERRKLNIGGTV